MESQGIFRRTAAEFTSENPTLGVSIFGYETDSPVDHPKLKVGDGLTAWNDLDYFSIGDSSGGGAVDSVNGQTGTVVLTTADIADSTNKRYVTDANLTVIGNTSGVNSGNETAASIGAIVNAATNYATPLNADKIGIWDVANSLFKAVTWANLKATLKTYFDTLYTTTAAVATQITTALTPYQLKTVVFKSTSDTSALTSTIFETKIVSETIAANTFASGDIIRITVRYRKTGTAGTSRIKIRIGTNDSTSDTLMADLSQGATLIYGQIERHFIIKTSSTIEALNPAATTNFTDTTTSGNAVTILSGMDFTQPFYIGYYGVLGNGTDSMLISFRLGEKL